MMYLFLGILLSYLASERIYTDQENMADKYLRGLNSAGLLNHRQKRQSTTGTYYYVTQCDYDITDNRSVPHSIEIMGRELENDNSVLKAARLIHRMVRFMPKDIFIRLAKNSAVGLFNYRSLPLDVIPELQAIPPQCSSSCNRQRFIPELNITYDCFQWCTTSLYPYNQNYPFNFLPAYGNFSRTFVVESNVICEGQNPSDGKENYLIREFALTIMTRGLDAGILAEISEAYKMASRRSVWFQLYNEYDYFMKATLVWFNGIANIDLARMNCKYRNNGAIPECTTGHHMRIYLKENDPKLHSILNRVYNNNRAYAQSYTGVCDW